MCVVPVLFFTAVVTPHMEYITGQAQKTSVAVVLHSTSDTRFENTTAVVRLPIRSSDHPAMLLLIVSLWMLQYSGQ